MWVIDFLFPRQNFNFAEFPPAPDSGIALFDYSDKRVKQAVWQLKYRGDRDLAEKFGALLSDSIISELNERNIYEDVLLIPMPISGKRRRERGFSQTELLCESIKNQDKRFVYERYALKKIRHTESQTKTMSRSERLKNLENSMEGDASAVARRFAVLVDDVTTTGATFSEAERALKSAGVRKVFLFAIAH